MSIVDEWIGPVRKCGFVLCAVLAASCGGSDDVSDPVTAETEVPTDAPAATSVTTPLTSPPDTGAPATDLPTTTVLTTTTDAPTQSSTPLATDPPTSAAGQPSAGLAAMIAAPFPVDGLPTTELPLEFKLLGSGPAGDGFAAGFRATPSAGTLAVLQVYAPAPSAFDTDAPTLVGIAADAVEITLTADAVPADLAGFDEAACAPGTNPFGLETGTCVGRSGDRVVIAHSILVFEDNIRVAQELTMYALAYLDSFPT